MIGLDVIGADKSAGGIVVSKSSISALNWLGFVVGTIGGAVLWKKHRVWGAIIGGVVGSALGRAGDSLRGQS